METVIITAGGIGKRMEAKLPKQFLCVGGEPILMRTVQRFYDYNSAIQILVTLPSDWMDFWIELCEKHNFHVNHQLIEGGKERFHSIKNALKSANGSVIGVHDGVRPFVSLQTIQSCFMDAKVKGAAIPFLEMKESIREMGLGSSKAANRSNFITIQTPQCFQTELLMKAYEQEFHDGITDDASLVEQLGVVIQLVSGNEENIKITSPIDLKIAELFV